MSITLGVQFCGDERGDGTKEGKETGALTNFEFELIPPQPLRRPTFVRQIRRYRGEIRHFVANFAFFRQKG